MVRLPAPERGDPQGVPAGLAQAGVDRPDSGPVLDTSGRQGIVRRMPADPMLVVRRHVDLQRVRSAICSDAR
ncbi:putative leader peptide [Nonomuraea sp. NPDC059194]